VWRSAIQAELELGWLVALDVEGFRTESQYAAVRRSSRRLSRRGRALLEFLAEARESGELPVQGGGGRRTT
jgi:DNA-binding transcriptional LysR family regulator